MKNSNFSPLKQPPDKTSPKRGSKSENVNAKSPVNKTSKPTTKGSETIVKQESNYLARCNNYRLTSGYEVTICNCKHIRKIRIGERHSICNPQRWLCTTCLTTESVWACLSCPNVACGRYIQEHALNHFEESGHPLVIDVNELYVYCYKCDDYVLNDNNSSDIKVLRETLLAIRYQNFTGTTRSGHTLRSAMITEQEDLDMRRQMQQEQLDRDDRLFTAIWHSRFVRQRKAFRQWMRYIRWKRTRDIFKSESEEETEESSPEVFNDPQPVENLEIVSEDRPLLLTIEIDTKSSDSSNFDTGLSELPPSPRLELEDDVLQFLPSTEVSQKMSIFAKKLSESDTPKQEEGAIVSEDVLNEKAGIEEASKSVTDMEKNLVEVAERSPESGEIRPIVSSPVIESDTMEVTGTDSQTDTGTTEDQISDDAKESDDEDDLSDDVKPIALNILSRPKRSNAAGRYKEIFSNLMGLGPVKREAPPSVSVMPTEGAAPVKNRSKFGPSMGGRRSIRIRRIERDKEIIANKAKRKHGPKLTQRKYERDRRDTPTDTKKKKRGRPRIHSLATKLPKKRPVLPKKRSVGSKVQRARRLITNSQQERRRLNSYRPPSLYDNIPNKAVASLIPGVTGLRNLGNTCYLNSIIQVLGHLQKFRLCLLALRELEFGESIGTPIKSKMDGFLFSTPQGRPTRAMTRRSTIELYNEQVKPASLSIRNSERKISGLNGGHSPNAESVSEDLAVSPACKGHQSPGSGTDSWSSSLSLCNELDHLYQVMWSGKWKLVSPYHFLHSVWNLIPSFRGYTQQDAQEFLCELLDKIVSELERCYSSSKTENKLALRILKVVQNVFEGRLMSRVRCLECGHISSTVEPFWDLSLEFPERYHKINSKRRSSTGNRAPAVPSDPCTLHEMLQNFTAPETLEGGRVYGCTKCNNFQQQVSPSPTQKKRPLYRKNSQLLTEAEKQLKVLELPQVLRFHLKRFRWIGRNHREKIVVHVEFPPELDMRPYCWNSNGCETGNEAKYMYDLSAVVMHHGRGFGSGHYTANCWNDIGEFWVHCNDSNLELRSIEDIMKSQAYILFYTQRGLDPQPHVLSPPITPMVSSPINLSPKPLEKEGTTEEKDPPENKELAPT